MLREAAIDNDFVMHLAEIDNWTQDELEEYISVVFREFSVDPIMHELVYENELYKGAETKKRSVALDFFEHKLMHVKEFEEYLTTDDKRKYYETVLKEIYYDFKGPFPTEIKDVFRDWIKGASLGEAHTTAMCLITGCGIILSDDGDSKVLASILKDKMAFDVNVYNRLDVCDSISKMGSQLKKDIRKVIKHTRCR